MFKSSTDRGTLLCCMLIYLKTVTVVTDAVRISLIILITHVYAAVIYKRFELN